MSLSTQVMQRSIQAGPRTSARRRVAPLARAAELDRHPHLACVRLALPPEVSRHRISLGEHAARLYAAIAT